MKTISIYNNKGGVGKTTTTKHLIEYLKSQGNKLLVIDFDPQANLSRDLIEGYNPYGKQLTIYDLLMQANVMVDDVKVKIDDLLDVIPSGTNHEESNDHMLLNAIEENPSNRLTNKIKNLEEYNYILIDCAPTKGLLATVSLSASNGVIVPISNDKYAVDGIRGVIDTINIVKEKFNSNCELTGIFLNNGKSNTKNYEDLHNNLLEILPGVVTKTKVYNYSKVNEDTFTGKVSQSEAKKQFEILFEELQIGV